MASTPNEPATIMEVEQPRPPTLEELAIRGARALILPYLMSYYGTDAAQFEAPREIVVVINPRTGSFTVVEGNDDLESILRGRRKEGPLPASKASIEAMPLVEVVEEGLECCICLADFEVGGEAKEMPCKHRYHSGCIDKWLGLRGSCPVCRFRMPEEEEEKNEKEGDDADEDASGDDQDGGSEEDDEAEEDGEETEEEEEEEQARRDRPIVIYVYFARRRTTTRVTGLDSDNNGGIGSGDGNSGSDNESSTQDMEIDG